MSYVRQVPKFLQARAHLLGKGAVASLAGPEGATLVQDVDSDKEDEFEQDDGVRQICLVRGCCKDQHSAFVLLNNMNAAAACREPCSGLLLKTLSLPDKNLPCSS